ncbi:MAG: DUF3373 domain-containing protein [Proteobacteria bacterium]|nr:DUF3373 domain-containing protein [Pseudomonadota bacterium]MBU4294895.1 DUF3373 domain-containing protein [Pseudomonadota bacterium]MCG2750128.1 DUF3373 domain-containing protein [Desulfobulbaceae bacterium]
MKKYLLTAGALLLWSGTAFAGGADTVTMPANTYKAIMDRLDTLQKRVDMLEEGGKTAPSPAPAAAVTREEFDKLNGDINNIYDTLDVVETKTLKDRINWGAELRTRVDNYKLSDLSAADMGIRQTSTGLVAVLPGDDDENDDNNWTNRFRLNMDAKINPTLSFHGRMTVYKNWGDSDYTTTALYNDMNRAHRPETSGVKLDRAYVDWVPDFVIPIALTVGRHPSTEGPPLEIKENRQRQSTYPALLFDAENDGIVATLGLERYTGLKNSGWRFAYGKGYHSDDDNNSSFSFLDDNYAGDTNMYATFLESEIPGLDNSLVVLSYARMTDLPGSFIGADQPETLGDMDLYGIHLQANKFLKSNFDLFVSWAGNKTDANGEVQVFPNVLMPDGVTTQNIPMGLLSADGNEDNSGSCIFAGLAYTIPFTPLNHPKIGFEYNHGSKYWMSMTMASTEMFNKLATRGDAYELYYIQPVNENLFFRAGYTLIEYEYTGSGSHLGQPQETDAELENYYLLMDVRF